MKKKLAIYFTVLFCFISFLCGGVVNTQAAVSKYKIESPSAIWINVNKKKHISLSGHVYKNPTFFKVQKIVTSSKNLKARVDAKENIYAFGQTIYLYGTKEGTYSLNITIKIKKTGKQETIKIPVYIGDINPIAEIKIGNKKLKTFNDNENPYPVDFYSEKSSGKMNVIMNKNYTIHDIEIHSMDRDYQNTDSFKAPIYNRGGNEGRIKNGENVTLNSRAMGKTRQTTTDSDSKSYSDYWSPVYSSIEDFSFRTARTWVTIYYYEKHSDVEQRVDIDIYTRSK